MRIICCMKTKMSYDNLMHMFVRDNLVWEQYMQDFSDIREKIAFSKYDVAIIDVKLMFSDEAIELCQKKGIGVLIFEGDFEEVFERFNAEYPVDASIVDHPIIKSAGMGDKPFTPHNALQQEQAAPFYGNRIVEKIVPEYKTKYTYIKNQLIIVVNLSKRAGSTFFTVNFAKFLSSLDVLTCVVEPPLDKPYIFDTIDLEARLDKKGNGESLHFYSYPHAIFNGEPVEKGREALDDGIIWLIPDSRRPLIVDTFCDTAHCKGKMCTEIKCKSNKWDYVKMMKLLYATKKASVTIADCGSHVTHESVSEVLTEADTIIVMVDPLPTECTQNIDLLEMLLSLKKKGYPIEFIVNRWNDGVNIKEFNKFLGVNPLMYIPAIHPQYVYKAIYEGKIPFEIPEARYFLQKSMSVLVKRFVPEEVFTELNTGNSNDHKANVFSRIKNKLTGGS